jgi:nitrate/TMAO reductase-like tetraheme cytochrome c subunit
MAPETSDQAQADTLARAMLLIVERAAVTRKRAEVLEQELKAMAVENERLRAKCHRYEIADIERRRYEEEG